jgi:hypothetical protein
MTNRIHENTHRFIDGFFISGFGVPGFHALRRWNGASGAWALACLVGAVSLFSGLPASAVSSGPGTMVVEKVNTPPLFGLPAKTRVVQTWIRGNMLRRDEGERSRTFLITGDSGSAWILNHRDRTKRRVSPSTMQGLSMIGISLFGIASDPETGKPVIPAGLFGKTGRSRLFDGRLADEYVVQVRPDPGANHPPEPTELWIGRDPGLDIDVYIRILEKTLGGSAVDYQAFFSQLRALGGYPVYIRAIVMGGEITQTLLELRESVVPDSVFSIPAGYRLREGANPPAGASPGGPPAQ